MKTICGRMPFSSNPSSSEIEKLIKKRGEEFEFFMVKIETKNERLPVPSLVLNIDATNDVTEFANFLNTYGVTFFKKNQDGTIVPFI